MLTLILNISLIIFYLIGLRAPLEDKGGQSRIEKNNQVSSMWKAYSKTLKGVTRVF